jgi:hypothetical protein
MCYGIKQPYVSAPLKQKAVIEKISRESMLKHNQLYACGDYSSDKKLVLAIKRNIGLSINFASNNLRHWSK